MDAGFEAAKALFLEGVALLEQARPAEAEARLLASLQHLPGRPSTLVNLGLTRLALGRPADALAAFDDALAADPQAPDAPLHRAAALASLGRLDDAAAQLAALLAAHPGFGAAWALLGQVEKDRGREDAARAALERALALGHDDPVTRYALAGLGVGQAPPTAPRRYVQALFDGYASDFEQHLVDVLHYRGHQAVVEAAAAGAPWPSALDLGCGSGLCGPGLRPLVARLEGVDLSATMLARARARGVYDTLVQADIVQHLQATPQRHGLVTAADVFIYVGELAPVFAGVRRVLLPGGAFVFTAEAAEAPVELRASLRYAHGEAGLRALAAAHGFTVQRFERTVLRQEQRRPIEGFVVRLAA